MGSVCIEAWVISSRKYCPLGKYGAESDATTKEIRYSMWITAHDAYMVGKNWLRDGYSVEMKERHECKIGGEAETMEHIL